MLSIEEQERTLAKRLREEREKKHISQIDLAFKAGLSQNIVTFIETGKRSPNTLTIFKICNALEINPAILFSSEKLEKAELKKEIFSLIEKL